MYCAVPFFLLVKFLQWPPLSGTCKKRRANKNRRSQASVLLLVVTPFKIAVIFLEIGFLEPLGILFRILTCGQPGLTVDGLGETTSVSERS